MITPHRCNTIESLCGTGTVFLGQKPVATAQYWLEVRHAMPSMRSASGSHRLDEPSDIDGRIEILTGGLHEAIEDSDLFVLQLEDGRQLPLYPDETGSTFIIVAAGGLK